MSAREETDCGRDRIDPTPLDKGLCCHDKVPLRESVVVLRGGLGSDG